MNRHISKDTRVAIVVMLVLLMVGLLSSCEKPRLGTSTIYIRATHPVEIRLGEAVRVWDKMNFQLPDGAKVYVKALSDSVAVCINDYCYKLYRGQEVMGCALPYNGLPKSDEYLFDFLND